MQVWCFTKFRCGHWTLNGYVFTSLSQSDKSNNENYMLLFSDTSRLDNFKSSEIKQDKKKLLLKLK